MQYLLKTKTPIWTGGVEGICDTIHETGIIGSLRWWYEVILRGLGVFACDPTEADDPGYKCCPIGENEHKQWCNACDFFGMTGMQRKFKLNIIKGKPVYTPEDQRINIKPTNPQRHNGWYLGAGRISDKNSNGLRLTLTPFVAPKPILNTMEVLLCLISKWGGIGARQQHGYGIFEIANSDDQKLEISEAKLDQFLSFARQKSENLRNTSALTTLNPMPNLNNFFFAKIQLKGLADNWQNRLDGKPIKAKQIECFDAWHNEHSSRIFAASLKNQLRFVAFDLKQNEQRELFGYSDEDKKCGAKINVSHAYDENGEVEVRIWGEISTNYACLCNELYVALKNAYYWSAALKESFEVIPLIIEWREINGSATRCIKGGKACTTPCADAESFIRCLLGI